MMRLVECGGVHHASCSKVPSPNLQQSARAHQSNHVHIQIVFRLPRLGTEDAATSSSQHEANRPHLGELAATPSKIAFSQVLKWLFSAVYFALKVLKDISLFSLAFSVVVSALPLMGLALALSLSILLLGATVAGSLIFFTCIIRSVCWLHLKLKQASIAPYESGAHGSASTGYPFRALQFLGEVVATAAGLVDVWGTEILGETVATTVGWIDATFFDAAFNQHFEDIDQAEERLRTRLAFLKAFPRVKFSQLRKRSCPNQILHRLGEGKLGVRRSSDAIGDQLAAEKYALENNACPICLEDFLQEEQVCQLSPVCVHFFHTRCIDPWLAGGNCMCPVCRSKLFPEEDLNLSRRDIEYVTPTE